MDYDWLSTNDFAGEAVAPLSDFCWPGRPNASPAGKSVQPVILHLSRSKPSGTYTAAPGCINFFIPHILIQTQYCLLGRPEGRSLGFHLLLCMKSHSIQRCLCQLKELLPSVCSPLQRNQSWGCWTPASGTGRLRSLSAGWRRLKSQWRRSESRRRRPCWCFTITSCNLCSCTGTMFTIFGFFSYVTVCSVIIPTFKKKNKETVKLIAVSSLGELPVTVQPYDVSVLLYFRI